MSAIRMAFRAEVRHRWTSWLAVALLISIVAGVVLAAVAAGRRTDAAFPRFVAARGFDAGVYAARPTPAIARLPNVTSTVQLTGPDNGQPTCACTQAISPTNFGVTPSDRLPIFKMVSGRLPNPTNPNEVLASYTLQQDDGVHIGSVIRVPFYARSQLAVYNSSPTPPSPTGPTIAFRVVGFEASPPEFPSGGVPSYSLYTSAAFARTVLPQLAVGYGYFVRLQHGAADLPRFDAAVSRLGSDLFAQNEDAQVTSVEASIHPQAIGWWLLAALAALVGLAVIGQALSRQSLTEGESYPTLAALGMERRQLVVLGCTRNLVVGLVGACGAVAVATVLSPIAPLGEARVAESSTGIAFDSLVMGLGVIATVVVVFALGLWSAVLAAQTARRSQRVVTVRPSAIVRRLGSVGARPSIAIGVRNALERRSSVANVPVGSALLATVLAVLALCATAVFGASLSNLTASPTLYGDPFQLNISNSSGGPGPANPAVLSSLEHDRAVTGITQGVALPAITINHVIVGAVAGTPIRGPLLLSTVDGHSPDATGEVGLGAVTMRQVGAHVGSIVNVALSSPSGTIRTSPFRVVAQMSLPVLGGAVSLGTGAVFTLPGYQVAACGAGPAAATCRGALAASSNGGTLVSVVAGPRGQATIHHYLTRYPTLTNLAVTPTSLINFGEAVNFPLLFGAMLAVFGAATLLHLLVVSVSRRRREVGLLKVVGFVRAQIASTVAWQATTLALVGMAIGVPLGVAVGRIVWHAFANNLGAVPVSVVPVWLIAIVLAGVLVVTNLIAAGPALAATRSKPADLLRATRGREF